MAPVSSIIAEGDPVGQTGSAAIRDDLVSDGELADGVKRPWTLPGRLAGAGKSMPDGRDWLRAVHLDNAIDLKQFAWVG